MKYFTKLASHIASHLLEILKFNETGDVKSIEIMKIIGGAMTVTKSTEYFYDEMNL